MSAAELELAIMGMQVAGNVISSITSSHDAGRLDDERRAQVLAMLLMHQRELEAVIDLVGNKS